MIKVRYVEISDKECWYQFDHHLPEKEFENKVKEKRGYVLLENEVLVGILRYNLFWDNIPFCTMIFIDKKVQGLGYETHPIDNAVGTPHLKFWSGRTNGHIYWLK